MGVTTRKGARTTAVGSPAGVTSAGRAPTRASRPADGVHHFRQGVFSPPVVLAGASLSPTATASDAVWGENSTRQRMVLALVAETLLEVHLRSEHDMRRNGGVPAVLFLSKLMCCSAMLRDAAGANSLWAPLISACFGADAYAASALRVSDSAVKERMQHHIFGAIARGLHAAPSMWCYSLFIERGSHARTSAIVFDEGGLPSMRPLTRDERQRVVFWRPRFKLLDDMGDAFSISPRAAARVADDAPKLKCPAALLRVPPSGSMPTATRMLEVIAPEGAPCVTLELLVTSLSAFESGWRAREGRVDLLQDLLVTDTTLGTAPAPEPALLPMWLEHTLVHVDGDVRAVPAMPRRAERRAVGVLVQQEDAAASSGAGPVAVAVPAAAAAAAAATTAGP